ncbi:MAG: hypothetical protein QHC90_24155 [Shinella sp.]|nr:hypothetical protein [Shinella sp.]
MKFMCSTGALAGLPSGHASVKTIAVLPSAELACLAGPANTNGFSSDLELVDLMVDGMALASNAGAL